MADFGGNMLDETHFFASLENTDRSHRLIHRTM
jgi:hypothetical protein